MNNKCDITRDLMPLYIDDVASKESEAYVDEHLAECVPCQDYFESMKTPAPTEGDSADATEQAEFTLATGRLRKKRRWRILRNILIGFVIGIVVIIALAYAWTAFAMYHDTNLPLDEYSVSLAQLRSGDVVVSVDYQDTNRMVMGTSLRNEPSTTSMRSDRRQLTVSITTSMLPIYVSFIPPNGPCAILSDIEQFDSIVRLGEEEPLWQKGDPIPAASKEMEAYYQAEIKLAQYQAQSTQNNALRYDDQDNWINDETNEEITLLEATQRLKKWVPEWK